MGQPPWFFAPRESWGELEITLDANESHHALHVMRIAPPDVVTVTDGEGAVARAAASRVEENRLVVEILERDQRRRPRPEIALYQAAVKGHKLDETVEWLAQLGVAEFWAFEARRSVARWDRDKVEKLVSRWGGIARAAAKQSRNAYAMKTGGGLSRTELVRRVAQEPLALVLWEEAAIPLRTALSDVAPRLALVVGPEGGFEREEAEALADAGAQLVSLGPQILRTETAPVVATSALLYHYGLIG